MLDAELDAVYNPLPNDLHRPWSLAALRAGKHVLTEKPLVLNAAEARELADVAQATGRVLLEAFAYRFHPHIARLRELVQAGELGELRAVRAAFGFTLDNPDDFRWEADKGAARCLTWARTP
ncbi:Gfo/Idh/MocA family protein [Deinococcus radiopugnans]|uniref:Gfo/Idh/MocA family protein n=1 Tax=Deinococcus radiopugnans TaxID=57497 RepID=UPI00360A1D6F